MSAIRDIYGESEFTPSKQAHVREIFRKHLGIVGTLAGIHPRIREYTYMDLYAGHGGHESLPGSPLIFLDEAQSARLPVRVVCMETNRERAEQLRARIDPQACAAILTGRCEDQAVPWLRQHAQQTRAGGGWLRGLIYADPNGELAWDTIRSLVQIESHLDVLIYYSANMRKRVRSCGKTYNHAYLADLMATLNKKLWFIREPAGAKEWTFLFGTNFDSQDGIRRIGFVRTDTDRGGALYRGANYTKKERAVLPITGQLALFGGE